MEMDLHGFRGRLRPALVLLDSVSRDVYTVAVGGADYAQ